MRGNIISLLALLSCIPVTLKLFSFLKPREAILAAFIGAFLFLPMDHLDLPIIDYNKMTATSLGILLATKMYDEERLSTFQFMPVDIPMVLWCLSGFTASMANGLGPYDGMVESIGTTLTWGVPYFVGRLYFTEAKHLRTLAFAMFLGALAYIPFILYELRMSPQLHRIVYGYMQHDFSQTIRGGGYRPMVFMQHGLMLGMWMAMCSLVAIWCYYAKVWPKKMFGVPTVLLVVGLFVITIACKSSGAAGLLLIALMLLFISTRFRLGILMWILIMIPPAYIATRATGYWDGQNLVDFISDHFSADRAASLEFRLDNENLLVAKALERPIFGWGGWGRSRIYDEETGEDISTTDGFWIITLGTRGYFGLLSVTAAMLLPGILFLRQCPARLWKKPEYATATALSFIPVLFMIDNMLNAMIDPVFILIAGGLNGMLAERKLAAERLEAELTESGGVMVPGTDPVVERTDWARPRTPGTRYFNGGRKGLRGVSMRTRLINSDGGTGIQVSCLRPVCERGQEKHKLSWIASRLTNKDDCKRAGTWRWAGTMKDKARVVGDTRATTRILVSSRGTGPRFL